MAEDLAGQAEPSMCGAHLSDMEVATRVRMLMRDDLDHEAVCVMARDRIRHLSAQNARLQEAAATIERLTRERDEAREEREHDTHMVCAVIDNYMDDGWLPDALVRSLFLRAGLPVPERLQPSGRREARAAAIEEAAPLRAALEHIERAHLPDQPAAFGPVPDEVWAQQWIAHLRGIARRALAAAPEAEANKHE